jgi:hypothetical protein
MSSAAKSRSLIKIRNRIGPRTLPWGTPDRTSAQLVNSFQFHSSRSGSKRNK